MVETITPQKLLTLAEQLTLADQQWLFAQLDRLIHQQEDMPATAVDSLTDEAPALTQAEAEQQFLAEVAAFEQLKPTLLKNHYGKVVAIYQGQVAVVGATRATVLQQMRERFGNVPCYVESVEENVPRRVRVPLNLNRPLSVEIY